MGWRGEKRERERGEEREREERGIWREGDRESERG